MGRGLFSGMLWGSLMAVMSLWVLSQVMGVVGLFEAPSDVSIAAPDASGNVKPNEDEGPPKGTTTSSEIPVQVTRQAETPPSSPVPENPTPIETQSTIPGPAAATVVSTPDVPALGGETDAPERAGQTGSNDRRVASAGQPISPAQDALPLAIPTEPPARLPELSASVTQPTVQEVVDPNAAVTTAVESVPKTTEGPDRPENPVAETSPGVAPGGDFASPVVVPTPDVVPGESAKIIARAEPLPIEIPNTDVLDGDGQLESQAPLENVATNVRINRLPSIGNSGSSFGITPEVPKGVEPDAVAETEEANSGMAIEAYSMGFENPDHRPLMAVVLLPDTENSESVNEPLPFPVSFVVDASRDDAQSRMRTFRDNGFEVAALMPLPVGATPQDVETAFQIYLDRVPEAVAVIDTDQAVFQSGRAVATQVVQVLADTGHGMITYSKGLNSAPQVAEREGVPAALVFRDIDGDGQDVRAIKRFLDQAAFRAGQQSGVILVGHNRPDTIRALLEWSLGNRASTVALAPVSAVLKGR